MIKLVTQFDNEKTKMSLATPTCGCCCCCCCCCIVTTFATASISARNFGDYVEKELPEEPKKIKSARRFGFWFPFGLLASLGIGLNVVDSFELDAFVTLGAFGIIYLFIVTFLLMRKINLSGIIPRVIFFTIILGVLEIIGIYLGLIALGFLGGAYLIIAIITSIMLITWAFGKKYDNLDKEINNNDIDIAKDETSNDDIDITEDEK